MSEVCEISGHRQGVAEAFALFGFYAAYVAIWFIL
jgi:hypothetical protein